MRKFRNARSPKKLKWCPTRNSYIFHTHHLIYRTLACCHHWKKLGSQTRQLSRRNFLSHRQESAPWNSSDPGAGSILYSWPMSCATPLLGGREEKERPYWIFYESRTNSNATSLLGGRAEKKIPCFTSRVLRKQYRGGICIPPHPQAGVIMHIAWAIPIAKLVKHCRWYPIQISLGTTRCGIFV